MEKVETVILSGNPIEKININFHERIPIVKFLYIDNCRIRDFDESRFRNLQNLSTLDLSYNLIEEVPKQSIKFGKNLELDLIGNRIKKFDGR